MGDQIASVVDEDGDPRTPLMEVPSVTSGPRQDRVHSDPRERILDEPGKGSHFRGLEHGLVDRIAASRTEFGLINDE